MEAGAAKQRTVMIVDDHPAVRELCRLGLEAAGLRVVEAADGAEAMERIRLDRPNLILLDIMMPRLSGWEVAARLLNETSTNDIPIIFISALTGLHERKRASELGAFDYLTKPLDPAELAKSVTEALDRIERGDSESLLAETFGRAPG
jgi:CheY-like chemotaxis protein